MKFIFIEVFVFLKFWLFLCIQNITEATWQFFWRLQAGCCFAAIYHNLFHKGPWLLLGSNSGPGKPVFLIRPSEVIWLANTRPLTLLCFLQKLSSNLTKGPQISSRFDGLPGHDLRAVVKFSGSGTWDQWLQTPIWLTWGVGPVASQDSVSWFVEL